VRVELHSLGGLHDFVEYDDSSPWPTGPDGGGTTLELIESTIMGGTPGEKNSVTP
jgi:hypothetical protein